MKSLSVTVDPPLELWRNKHIKNMMSSSILWQGNVFGFNNTHLTCISWETGDLHWNTRDVRKGCLILAAGKLILLRPANWSSPKLRNSTTSRSPKLRFSTGVAGPLRSWPEDASMPATRRGKSSHSMYEPVNSRKTSSTGGGRTGCLAFEQRGFLYQLRS